MCGCIYLYFLLNKTKKQTAGENLGGSENTQALENMFHVRQKNIYVTLQHKTSRLSQSLESEILVLYVARAFHQYIRYYNTITFDRYGHLNVQSRDNRNFTK
jgi:hypothetical protein